MRKTLESLYARALKERGVVEGPGDADNKRVLQYYKDAGHGWVEHDSVPWCGAFVGAMLKREGWKPPKNALSARAYLSYWRKARSPSRGCIVVLERGPAPFGHVAFFHDWGDIWGNSVWLLGGNQRNMVSIARFPTSKILGYRVP